MIVHSLTKANQRYLEVLSHTKRHNRFDIAHSVIKSLSRTFAGEGGMWRLLMMRVIAGHCLATLRKTDSFKLQDCWLATYV